MSRSAPGTSAGGSPRTHPPDSGREANGTRRALELLTTALEIDHTFPTALYNAGLAHHLLGACFGRADGWTGRFVIAT